MNCPPRSIKHSAKKKASLSTDVRIEPGENEHFADIFVQQLQEPQPLKGLDYGRVQGGAVTIVDQAKQAAPSRQTQSSAAGLEQELLASQI